MPSDARLCPRPQDAAPALTTPRVPGISLTVERCEVGGSKYLAWHAGTRNPGAVCQPPSQELLEVNGPNIRRGCIIITLMQSTKSSCRQACTLARQIFHTVTARPLPELMFSMITAQSLAASVEKRVFVDPTVWTSPDRSSTWRYFVVLVDLSSPQSYRRYAVDLTP